MTCFAWVCTERLCSRIWTMSRYIYCGRGPARMTSAQSWTRPLDLYVWSIGPEIGRIVRELRLYNPPHLHPRIGVQSSCFTLHPEGQTKAHDPWPGGLTRILIPNETRAAIRHHLFRLGVHRAALFPDLENAAVHIFRTWTRHDDERSILDETT